MQYKIIVDKQSSANPSTDKREYIIDIEELRFLKDVYDTLVITKDEDYVMRRLSLSEYGVLKVLETPIKEPLENVNIQLFEGDNYIYIQDMSGNKFYAEYLVKNDFTDMYVTVNQMNSAMTQTAGQIELTVNQKLKEYATTEELEENVTQLNATISATAKEINLEVSKKVNDEDLTGANIMLKINGDSSEAQINADKININGTISANGNFKVDTDGNMECYNGKFNGGEITLKSVASSYTEASFQIAGDDGSRGYMSSRNLSLAGNSDAGIPSQVLLEVNDTEPSMSLLSFNLSDVTQVNASGISTPILTQTSRAENKKNFEKLENGLDIVKQVDIYKYNLKSEEDTKKKHIGFVIGEDFNYAHEITSEDKEGKEVGVDTYSMISVLWKAVQELTEKVKRLEGANEEN